MPAPAVIFWESSKSKDIVSIRIRFPNKRVVVYKVPVFKVLEHSISELEGMALLLPFYILKIRKELRRKSMDSAKRKALSKELESYVIEIDKILKRCKENSYITSRDAAMLFRRLLYMNMELYGQYPEFKEVDMTLKDLADTDMDEAIDKAESRGISQGINQSLSRTAKAMKKGGEAIDKIMRYTGLSRREIAAL
jgi:predicted transposase/invertase (TIGR01784 family)